MSRNIMTALEISMKKTREHLPLFKVLPRPPIDIQELQRQIKAFGYDDYAAYKDMDFGGEFTHLCNQYSETHAKFTTDEEAKNPSGHFNGQMYRQLALTSFDHERYPGIDLMAPIKNRRKAIRFACEKESVNYCPQLDERNYCIPNSLAKGMLLDILKSFKAKFTRTRLAVLMPGFQGKPHIDYNTDYSIRVHIPIFTNEGCTFNYVTAKGLVTEYMPADGRMWYINTGYTHYVTNNSAKPRLHLVVNLESQEDLYE